MSKEKSKNETIAVERSIWVDASIDRVWQAVTNEAKLSEWYSPGSPWKIPDVKVGKIAEFHLSPNPHHSATEVSILKATIDVVEPPYKFALGWHPDPSFPGVGLVTTFLLSEENGGTRVTLYESGYESVSPAERQEWLDQVGEGYGLSMENLKALVEGREIPHR